MDVKFKKEIKYELLESTEDVEIQEDILDLERSEDVKIKDELLENNDDVLSGCHSEQVWVEEGILEKNCNLNIDVKSEIEARVEHLSIEVQDPSNDQLTKISELDKNLVCLMYPS
ncbi:UNVERIFIED_CONTAM: hypothetical protein RMT77_014573 [Armadillidium vulgare]